METVNGSRYEVRAFTPDKLAELLSEDSISSPEIEVSFIRTRKKLHLLYFQEYLSALDAKTVVIEHNYIDRGYLEDYAGYYVRCFAEYKPRCTRLHFFSNDISSGQFTELLQNSKQDDFEEIMKQNYLGFMVVRPLPDAIIGRTCLKTYPEKVDEIGLRCYDVCRDYEVFLYGIKLPLKTLAFQEQDTVAAACASTALWSAFQATSKLYSHEAISPIEVTRRATKYYVGYARPVPSSGLTPNEVVSAIRETGLESQTYNLIHAQDDMTSLLKSLVYAFTHKGTPVILGFAWLTISENGELCEQIDQHAITVAGYRIGGNNNVITSRNTPPGCFAGMFSPTRQTITEDRVISLTSDRINKLYVNDDNLGPFARMEFITQDDPKRQVIRAIIEKHQLPFGASFVALKTHLGDKLDKASVIALPHIAFIPVYHKIRVEYSTVFRLLADIDNWLANFSRKNQRFNSVSRIEWSLSLDGLNQWRGEIRHSTELDAHLKLDILTRPMPKYLWRAIGSFDGHPQIEFLFDATGLERSRLFLCGVLYNIDLARAFASLDDEHINSIDDRRIYTKWLLRSLKKQLSNSLRLR